MNGSAIQLSPDVLAAHRGLSPASARLLQHLLEHPDDAARLDEIRKAMPKWWFTYEDATALTWPTLIDARKRAELQRATEGVCALVKAIPAVIFDGDMDAMTEFYGYDQGYLQMLFEVPNALDTTLARCDFIDTADGLKCCEVNLAANVGGWTFRFWTEEYEKHPVITEFAAREGGVARGRDPLRIACEQVVEDAVASGVASTGELNVVVCVPTYTPWAARFAAETYAQFLRESGSGLTGELWLSDDPDNELVLRDNVPYLDGGRVHVIIEYGLMASRPVLMAQVLATTRVYNGGLTQLLVNKRNLALLSENAELEYWTDEDRALIRDHIPWTRLVSARTTTYRGETVEFPGFLLDRRAEMVLKRGEGQGGDDVYVGRFTDPAAWRARVAAAMEEGGWIVQEYVESKPYFYPPVPGAAPVVQSVIWGMFLAGWRYAGGWLRMMPAGEGDGIVNSIRGAAEGAILEIE